MSSDNIQHRNAGNLGDIIKHAALLCLLKVMKARCATTPINYLDTHTFLLETDCANAQWHEQCDALAAQFPAYRNYIGIEAPLTKQGRYWCSCRLALAMLDNPHPQLFLAEANLETRKELRRQLTDFDLTPGALQNDMLAFATLNALGTRGPLVALVDPFFKTEEEFQRIWSAACHAIELLRAPDAAGLVEVYQWRPSESAPWPEPPKGFIGPIATISRPAERPGAFHHVAVYATADVSGEAQQSLCDLGWSRRICCDGTSVTETGPKKSLVCSNPQKAIPVGRRLFDRYIMADYSGAQSEKTQREKIVLVDLDSQPGSRNRIVRNLTRVELREFIAKALRDATKRKERVLFGLDHQFGWPMELLSLCGLERTDWRSALSALKSGSYGGPVLAHPVEFCGRFNDFAVQRNIAPPFFSPTRLYNLAARSNFNDGALPFRLTEKRFFRQGKWPKSATEIGTNGAVAGQTICGMLELALLIDAMSENNQQPAFWPFDGLDVACDEAYGNRHVGIEIYPTFCRPDDIEQSDENDALYSALWFKQKDAEGVLAQILNLKILSADESKIVREGWIAGCVPEAPEELEGRDTSPIRLPSVSLTPEQEAVLASRSPLLRVIARAGTGKTTTMVALAKKVLSEDCQARLAMLTFTRNAADCMRERFINSDGDGTRFEAGTYHGFALKRLLNYKKTVSLGDGHSIDLSRVSLLNELGRDSVLEFVRIGPGRGLNLADDWGDKLSKAINSTDPGNSSPAGLLSSSELAGAWRVLLKLYANEHLMDFDIIMVLFEYLLRTDAEFFNQSRTAMTHLVADEFQDTNLPQLRALERLAGYADGGAQRMKMTVVGDDFQTIYRWRGAVPGIFEKYAQWGPTATLGLRTNWRSAKDVLRVVNAAARRLAGHPDHVDLVRLVPPELELGRSELNGGVRTCSSVAEAVQFLTGSEANLPLASISVLAYKNDTALDAREDLRKAGIACELATARPSDVPGVRRFMALLSAWAARGQRDFATWWYLVSQYSGLTPAQFEDAWGFTATQATHENLETLGSLLGALETPFVDTCNAKKVNEATPAMLEWVARRFFVDKSIGSEQLTCLRLAQLLGDQAEFRSDPLRVLGEMTRKDFAAGKELSDAVQISTIHQYKGLENQGIVLVYDFNPLKDGDTLRLDYVARSRAARWLVGVHVPRDINGDWTPKI